jgi:voltage-gated potassium channel
VSPQHIGGLRLASELVRPNVTRFLDETLHLSETTRFEEVEITEHSSLVGKTLREASIREHAKLLVVALHHADNTYECNPGPDQKLQVGTRLIVLGESSGTERLRRIING